MRDLEVGCFVEIRVHDTIRVYKVQSFNNAEQRMTVTDEADKPHKFYYKDVIRIMPKTKKTRK